ncbi:MAG: alanyl-tRNA editing protein [Fusobacteriaceae bacterium]|jgi:alanyl-tRNA synthetase|nr:alanyl-tRNA editing protein [Fusobacteriaceae bacterium]
MQIEIYSCKQGKDGFLITVRENPFYIDGKGGQLGDRGCVGTAKVLAVNAEGILITEALAPGFYDFEIDEARRVDIAENHTAQHLFSGLAWKNFGLETVGFRMGENFTTVDFSTRDIPEETVRTLEWQTNDAIRAAIPVTTRILPHEEALAAEGLRRAIKDKVTGDVRFVAIGDIDLSACAGFHTENTKDIRLLKVLQRENIHGETSRFYLLAGKRAISDYFEKHEILRDICHQFSCREKEAQTFIEKALTEKKNNESELRLLADRYAELLAAKLKKDAHEDGAPALLFYKEIPTAAFYLGKYVDLANTVLVTGVGDSYTIQSTCRDCKDMVRRLCQADSRIKGGGNAVRGNFKAPVGEKELLDLLKSVLK